MSHAHDLTSDIEILFSRQSMTLGESATLSIFKAAPALIYGLNPLGSEIAKNLLLSGIHSIDFVIPSTIELSQQLIDNDLLLSTTLDAKHLSNTSYEALVTRYLTALAASRFPGSAEGRIQYHFSVPPQTYSVVIYTTEDRPTLPKHLKSIPEVYCSVDRTSFSTNTSPIPCHCRPQSPAVTMLAAATAAAHALTTLRGIPFYPSSPTLLPPHQQGDSPHPTHVLLVGAGALGCEILRVLVKTMPAGGHLHVSDPDTVARSNLTRQILFAAGDEGRSKAHQVAEWVKTRRPDLHVTSTVAPVTDATPWPWTNVKLPVSGQSTLGCGSEGRAQGVLVAAVDSMRARRLLTALAIRHDVPLINGGTSGAKGTISRVFSRRFPQPPLYFTPGDPHSPVGGKVSCGGKGRPETQTDLVRRAVEWFRIRFGEVSDIKYDRYDTQHNPRTVLTVPPHLPPPGAPQLVAWAQRMLRDEKERQKGVPNEPPFDDSQCVAGLEGQLVKAAAELRGMALGVSLGDEESDVAADPALLEYYETPSSDQLSDAIKLRSEDIDAARYLPANIPLDADVPAVLSFLHSAAALYAYAWGMRDRTPTRTDVRNSTATLPALPTTSSAVSAGMALRISRPEGDGGVILIDYKDPAVRADGTLKRRTYSPVLLSKSRPLEGGIHPVWQVLELTVPITPPRRQTGAITAALAEVMGRPVSSLNLYRPGDVLVHIKRKKRSPEGCLLNAIAGTSEQFLVDVFSPGGKYSDRCTRFVRIQWV